MVSVTPGQAFLNLGKNPKTDRLSKRCRKSRGTEHYSTPGDRQSHYEDCHTLHNRSRGTRGSPRIGCLSGDYDLHASTLRRVETAHNSIPDTGEIFLIMEDFCCSIFLQICQIKGFLKDLEANPKDSGDKYRRLLEKQLAYPSGPWMAGLFFARIWNAGRLTASFAQTRRKALQHWKRRKDI